MNRHVAKLGLALIAALAVAQGSGPVNGSAATVPGTSSNFTLVGHEPLFERGENAAGAIYDSGTSAYEYIGSRSDGTHPHSGVQIVDITDPAHPSDTGEIPLPTNPPLTAGYTSRELRVWPQQKVLMVIYFGCSSLIHACVSGSDTGEQPFQLVNFFDLTNPASPVLTSTYKPSTTPHEIFLWNDPNNAARALLYWTSPNNATKQLVVTDISDWKHANFPEIATLSTPADFRVDARRFRRLRRGRRHGAAEVGATSRCAPPLVVR